MKKLLLTSLVASSLFFGQNALAAGWKKVSVERLSTNGYEGVGNTGTCMIWALPAAGVDMSTECNGNGDAFYVTFDCDARSAATTTLSKSSAGINHANAQIAALTGQQISLYIEDVKVDGYCVATKTTLIFSNT